MATSEQRDAIGTGALNPLEGWTDPTPVAAGAVRPWAAVTAQTAWFAVLLFHVRAIILAVAMVLIAPTVTGLTLQGELGLVAVLAVGATLAVAHAQPNRLPYIILMAELPLAVLVSITRPEAMPLAALGLVAHLAMASILRLDDRWLSRSWALAAAALGIAVVAHPAPVTISTTVGFATIALLWNPAQRSYLRRLGEASWHRAVVDVAGVIMFEEDPSRANGLLVSPAAERLLGYPVDAFRQEGFLWNLFHPDDLAPALNLWSGDEHPDGEATMRLRTTSGRYLHFICRFQSITDSHGRHQRYRGAMIDVTHWREAELSSQRFGELAEATTIGLVIFEFSDPNDPASLVFRFANPSATTALGLTPGEIDGRSVIDIFDSTTAVVLTRSFERVLATEEPFDWDDMALPRAAGRRFDTRAVALPGNAVGWSVSDVTARNESEEILRLQALHDDLTGLPNRLLLADRVEQALRHGRRSRTPVALLVMDLDQFKEVNDTLGHHIGDQLLVQLSDRLRHELRDSDTFARLGGDEFAILLTHDATVEGARRAAQRVHAALDRPFQLDDVSIQAAASIGIAVSPDHATDAETLNRYADVAMYQAKRTGIRVSVYDPESDRSSMRRMTILGGLREAIDAGELELYYQPILDLHTGEVACAEALVRWHHPTQGLLSPDEFIELAELSGVIHPLTQWVATEAVTAIRRLAMDGVSLDVAVNVSARNLYDPTLVPHIAALMADHPDEAGRLILEITESELMSDPGQVLDVLGRMRELGVESSMDDFGTGYSSLSHLKLLPITSLKIDRSFVEHVTTDEHDATIVQSTIDLGHNLGLRVVAEGVEDMETLHHLLALGCDRAQGYLLSRPVPLSELTKAVSSINAGAFRPADDILNLQLGVG